MSELPIPPSTPHPKKIGGLALIALIAVSLFFICLRTSTLWGSLVFWIGVVALTLLLTFRLALTQASTRTLHLLNPGAVFLTFGLLFLTTIICSLKFVFLVIF